MSPEAQRPRFGSSSAKVDPKPLGEPMVFPFSGRTAQNRFLNTAMSERLASYDAEDVQTRGTPDEKLVKLYERWGQGEWGQILTGNVMIHPDHLEAAGNMVIPPDAGFDGPRFEAFQALATAAKKHGSLIVAQVSHPGRQADYSVHQHPISASDIRLVRALTGATYGQPRAATKEDIQGVIEGFAHAAEFLERAGFDGMQLHGAHGYLLAQFLSEATNHRTDEYGGSLENRLRIILEVAAAIKKRVSKEFILGIKINSVEFQDKGLTWEETRTICQALEGAEFDYVETSGGSYESLGFRHIKESTRARENYFIEWAEQFAKAFERTKVYTTGGFKTTVGMVNVMNSVDGIGIGRAAAQEPDLPKTILSGEVNGILKYAMEEDNIMGRMGWAVRQIHQMAGGEEPCDLTDEEVIKAAL